MRNLLKAISPTFLVAVLLLSACSGGQQQEPARQSSGQSAGQSSSQTSGGGSAQAGGSQTQAGTPKRDGTLIIAAAQEPGTLDPQGTTSLNAQRVREQMFDSLLSVDFDNTTLIPSLAESWEASPDGTTYTFKLRQDVKFHSGKAMTSEDVRYTFERWRSGRSPNRWLIDGLVEIQTPDAYTVIMRTDEPRPDFLHNIARSDASILNRESVEAAGQDFGTRVIDGTGPWRLKEYTVKNQIVLERFDEYKWAPPSYQNRGPAYLKQIIWKSMPEEATRLLELETGGIHMIPARVSFHEWDRIKQSRDMQLLEFPVGSTSIIAFNLRTPPMDDPDVRRATLHAIDTKRIIDQVLYGHAILGSSIVAPSIEGYCKQCNDVIPQFDQARARQILDDAGWRVGSDGIRVKDGRRLVIPATPYTTVPYPEAYTVIQAMLREVGIGMDLQPTETAKVFEMFQQGTHGMWSTSIPHDRPYQAVFNFLHSSAIPGTNRFPYNNPEVDKILEEAQRTVDREKQANLYAQAQYIALQSYILKPFFHEIGHVAISNKVKGFRPWGYVNSIFQKMTDTWVE